MNEELANMTQKRYRLFWSFLFEGQVLMAAGGRACAGMSILLMCMGV